MKRNFPLALKPRWEVLAASMLLCSSAGVYADTMPTPDPAESAAQSSPPPSAQSADPAATAESPPASTDSSPQAAQSAQPAEAQPTATNSEPQAAASAQPSDPATTAESQSVSTSPSAQAQQSPTQPADPVTTSAVPSASAGADPAPATTPAPGLAGGTSQAATSPTTTATNGGDTATQPTNDKVSDIVGTFDPQGVLTPKGHFVFDPSMQFATSSSNRVSLIGYTIIPAITIGLININKVTRNSFVAALDGRYGLTNRFEFNVHVPYVYQSETTTTNPLATPSSGPENFTASGGGIGDVQFGFRYQFNQPESGMPYYVGSLKVNAPTGKGPFDVPYSETTGLETKTPTGSGFWGVQPGVTFILPTDPAVFYGGLSYQYNFKRNVNKTLFIQSSSGAASSETINDVKPGNIVEVNFGMGFGINDKASFSIGYDHNVIGKTKINGQVGEGALITQVGELLIGYSYRIAPKQTVNLTLGVGVTPDSPDVQITLHAPFDL